LEALVDLLLAISRLVTDRGDIRELDLNPVRLYEQSLMVLNARMMVKKEEWLLAGEDIYFEMESVSTRHLPGDSIIQP